MNIWSSKSVQHSLQKSPLFESSQKDLKSCIWKYTHSHFGHLAIILPLKLVFSILTFVPSSLVIIIIVGIILFALGSHQAFNLKKLLLWDKLKFILQSIKKREAILLLVHAWGLRLLRTSFLGLPILSNEQRRPHANV